MIWKKKCFLSAVVPHLFLLSDCSWGSHSTTLYVRCWWMWQPLKLSRDTRDPNKYNKWLFTLSLPAGTGTGSCWMLLRPFCIDEITMETCGVFQLVTHRDVNQIYKLRGKESFKVCVLILWWSASEGIVLYALVFKHLHLFAHIISSPYQWIYF